MKGDFSAVRFDSTKHFNRVLKQQGRVDLEADWNEQAAIGQHLLRTLVVDLIGNHAGPRDNCGFGLVDWAALSEPDRTALKTAGLQPQAGDFVVTAGHYYVGGLLVENEYPIAYSAQPDWRGPKLVTGKTYMAYLDVHQRHITYIEDDTIREEALGGPDTCTRVRTSWQIKVIEAVPGTGGAGSAETLAKIETLKAQLNEAQAGASPNAAVIAKLKARIVRLEKTAAASMPTCGDLIKLLYERKPGMMRARIEPGESSDNPCVLSPDAGYRGLENHLYRIEVHRGSVNDGKKPPTFKWSRENGSVATRWLGVEGTAVRVASSRGFSAGHWVEITDDTEELQGSGGKLLQLLQVDADLLTVEAAPAWSGSLVHPKARRWDQQANDELELDDGAVIIKPGTGETGWIEIEYGIEVQFTDGDFRTGDYWLIPARVATGRIQWPGPDENPKALPANGIERRYAPLGMIEAIASDPFVSLAEDCRCLFAPLPCLPAK